MAVSLESLGDTENSLWRLAPNRVLRAYEAYVLSPRQLVYHNNTFLELTGGPCGTCDQAEAALTPCTRSLGACAVT